MRRHRLTDAFRWIGEAYAYLCFTNSVQASYDDVLATARKLDWRNDRGGRYTLKGIRSLVREAYEREHRAGSFTAYYIQYAFRLEV